MSKSQESVVTLEAIDKQSESSTPDTSSPTIPKEKLRKSSIKLSVEGAVQLTSPKSKKDTAYYDKRKWDDSFTVAEKDGFTGNIVKAARDNDGETYVTLQEEEFTTLGGQPGGEFTNLNGKPEEDSHDSDDSDGERKPGRRPMAEEEQNSDSDQDPKIKRKAQNRAAQRAFRERKERYVKELEAKIKQVQDTHLIATSQLLRENHQLRSIIYRLEAENYALKGIQVQYPPVNTQPQTTKSPHTSVQQQQSSGGNSGARGNYPAIAPLLPSPGPLQTPFILPGYPYSTSTIANVAPSADSSMMIIPSSPITINNSSPSPTLTSSTISSKKSNIKPKANTPPPQSASNNQPLEYTFAISTPASLKPSGGTVSNQYKNARTEPIELVQLFPPSSRQTQSNRTARNTSESPSAQSIPDSILLLSPKSNQSYSSSVNRAQSVVSSNGSIINDECSEKSGHSITTTQQKKMIQLESDLFGCHIDVEGQIFCERLHNEVCNDAFYRLLSEPLFDQMGKLNLSIGNYPVPIVTGPMTKLSLNEDSKNNNTDMKKMENELKSQISFLDSNEKEDKRKLLSVSEIWFALSQHPKFTEFSTDQLCQAVKDLAKCADSGPVLEEDDLYQVMQNMDKGKL